MRKTTIIACLWALLLCLGTAETFAGEVALTLTVPDTTWALAIDEIREVDGELWVLATVSPNPDVMGAQVITEVRASRELDAPDLPMRCFVIGKTWGWENPEPYTFIKGRGQIAEKLECGKLLYPKGKERGEERSNDPQKVVGRTWQWVSTVTPVARIEAKDPARYTMRLLPDGKAQLQIDCNKGQGSYTISPAQLSFGPLISTRMACPEGTQDAEFMRDLQRAKIFFLQGDQLYIDLPMDSGTMQFAPLEE